MAQSKIMKTRDVCPYCGVNHPSRIEQCEGCTYPLGSYIDQYEKGCLKVVWKTCLGHRS